MISVAMPAACACNRPAACGRFDSTSTISAGYDGSFAAAISAAMLDPRPEMRTATRVFFIVIAHQEGRPEKIAPTCICAIARAPLYCRGGGKERRGTDRGGRAEAGRS